MEYIPEDRWDRLVDKKGRPRKRIGDYGLLYRHGWARIVISLPFLGLGGLVILGWTRGEPADSWPLLCGGWVVGLVFLLDGLRTLGMIPTSDVPPPPIYQDPRAVMARLEEFGPYKTQNGTYCAHCHGHTQDDRRGNCAACGAPRSLGLGARSPGDTISSVTRATGEVNQWGEPIQLTASFNRAGDLTDLQFHLQDVPLVDRGGEYFDDLGGYLTEGEQ